MNAASGHGRTRVLGGLYSPAVFHVLRGRSPALRPRVEALRRDARRVMSKRRGPYFPAGRQRKMAVLLEGMRAGKVAVVLVAVKFVAVV